MYREDKSSSLVELLRQRAAHMPTQRAYTFLVDGEAEAATLTYGELDCRARALAAHLQKNHQPGERALLLYPSGLDYITAFFGCLYAGIVAVPLYPPHLRKADPRIEAIRADAQATLVLTEPKVLDKLTERLTDEADRSASHQSALHYIALEAVDEAFVDNWRPPTLTTDSLAYLQYTSGSTAAPKGVMVSHGNLLYNLGAFAEKQMHTPDDVFVSWLPFFHDMGLIYGVLYPLYQGLPGVLLSPTAFIQQPMRWLQAMTKYKATHTAAPNFAYALCIEKITPEQRSLLDLSDWRLALNGAETVRSATLARFTAAFAECGFRVQAYAPGYGLAEATLQVTLTAQTSNPTLLTVDTAALALNRVVVTDTLLTSWQMVGCGAPSAGTQIVIANPQTLARCSADEVGEIWVGGPTVAQGYWQRPDATRATFQAYLNDNGAGPFLRTGDLGFLHDGQLFITGRLKDLIIIRGRNHYPQDIEQTIEASHPALEPAGGAAFAVEVDGEERLVVLQEIRRTQRHALETETIFHAIRQTVAAAHDVQIYAIVLLKPASILKTSSGKIQRRACRTAYLQKELATIAEWQQPQLSQSLALQPNGGHTQSEQTALKSGRSISEVQGWLISHLAQITQLPVATIDAHQAFTYYGLDSATTVALTGQLSTWLGEKLPPTLAYDYPTIQKLAQHLGDNQAAPVNPLPTARHNDQPTVDAHKIAIIGLGCRFPGAENPAAFWQLLQAGVDAISLVPDERWPAGVLDAETATPGKLTTRWGGFLSNVDQFDPAFFAIAPLEATHIDPQQRLLLEVAWEALEYAGIALASLAGSATGVFVGISTNDYAQLPTDPSTRTHTYRGTGNAFSIAANRLSYLLDLRGPSLAIDTACSSSLVALHTACHSLRAQECSMALVGGVNLILSPNNTLIFSQAGMMAANGRCKTFDASADGYVRGEGCGVLVLKRLADAQRDGDNILAVIRGSAINQDGRTNGLTAPNGLAQQAVIQAALADAQVAPTQIGYVEAHGTGTALGDPIELVALKAVLLPGRPPEARGWIGSVKTNIGHLEAAAGIAGVIKVVLALQHREVPPHLHLQTLNPYISLDDTPLAIPTRQEPWTPIQGRRLAGVSSFGFGGSNAHMILEEAAQDGESGEVQETRLRREPGAHWARTGQGDREERTLHLLTLSAKNETGLQELVQRYLDYLTARPEMSLADICFTANTGRSHFPHRLALSAATTQQATTRLAALFAGEQSAGVAKGEAALGNQPRLAFLFSGQGSQYVGMGRELYETQPIFRTALDHCDEILRPLLGESILPVIYPETGDWSVASGTTNHPQSLSATLIDQTRYTQPALFALEYALATLWQAWGIQPDVLIGHSIGEVAAACVAGVFSLEDGLRLIAARGRLMGALPQGGEMVAVMADEAYVQKLIAPYQHQVSVAAINGPASVVISGKRGTVTAIVEQLTAAGIKTRQLTVSHAFHSPLMAPMLDVFRQVAESITYHPPKLRLISNITGQLAGDEIATSDYWVRHVRAAVRFADGVQTLHEQGIGIFLEIGPQPVLVALAQAIVDSRLTIDEKNSSAETIASPAMLPSLRPGRSDWQQMLESLGALYVQGVAIDWVGFDRDYLRRKVLLPTYPFQRQRYWIAPGEAQNRGAQPPNGFANWLTSTSTEQLTQLMADKGHFGADERETVARVLATLETESRSQQMAAQVESMLYEVAWEPSRPLMLPTLPTATGRWLVLADDTGVGEALATQLSELGQTVNVITATTELSEITTHLMIEAKAAPPLRGIVHLWGLTHPDLAAATLDVATLIQSQADTLGTLLHLVQTLAAHKGASPRLWVVTEGAQQLAAEQLVAVGQTPLWGLGRVVALEHSHLWGGLLDLDGTDVPAQSSKALLAELLQQRIDGENQVAYRNGVRYVARLARGKVKKVSAPPVAIHADACYLVTGGLGGLGLLVTNWLVTQGARHVVLTGRRGITQLAQQQIVAGWAAQGVSVQIAQVDVADEAGMRQLFAQLTASTNPLKGIFHTAGLLDDGILLKQSWARFTNVLTAKVGGSWLLHQLTQGIELDVLVYFSSVASLLGNLGQGNYAAANAFMDGLARHRQQQGLPGLSINWGGWAEVGMAARTAQVKADSHPLMTPQEGVKALEHLLGHRGQIGVARFDWKQIAALNREPQPFLAKWIESHKPTRDKASFVQELEALPNNRRLAHVRNHLQQALGRVLGMTELPARDIGFADLGMDSLMALELKRQLDARSTTPCPARLPLNTPQSMHWQPICVPMCWSLLMLLRPRLQPSRAP